jgi:chromosome segregation ATPase
MKEIQDKISKLEVVANSKMIPDSVKEKAKAEIKKLKEEMESMKEEKAEMKAEKPKKEPKEKKEKKEKEEKAEMKAEMSEKDCEDLLAKYKAERESRKERAEKREKQGKPAELTPAETAKKAVDRVTDKIEAKAEKGKSVKGDIKAVFSQFKSAVAELKKYKDEIDQNEVRSLIKELESLLTKKMATGGGVGYSKNDYVEYLNEIGVPEEDHPENGGRVSYKFINRYGEWLRKNDPIAFEVGYREWKSNN